MIREKLILLLKGVPRETCEQRTDELQLMTRYYNEAKKQLDRSLEMLEQAQKQIAVLQDGGEIVDIRSNNPNPGILKPEHETYPDDMNVTTKADKEFYCAACDETRIEHCAWCKKARNMTPGQWESLKAGK